MNYLFSAELTDKNLHKNHKTINFLMYQTMWINTYTSEKFVRTINAEQKIVDADVENLPSVFNQRDLVQQLTDKPLVIDGE